MIYKNWKLRRHIDVVHAAVSGLVLIGPNASWELEQHGVKRTYFTGPAESKTSSASALGEQLH